MDVVSTYSASVALLTHAVLVAAFVCASIVDVRTRFVPASSLAASLVAWAAAVISGLAMGACPFLFASSCESSWIVPSWVVPSWVVESLAGGLAAGGVALASSLAVERRSGAMALGGGDVKLLFVAGLYLGPAGGLAMLGAACMLALVGRGLRVSVAIPVRAIRNLRRRSAFSVRPDAVGGEEGRFSIASFRRPFAFAPFLTVALILVLSVMAAA